MKKIIEILSVAIVLLCLLHIGYQKVTDFMVKKTLTMIAEDDSVQNYLDTVLEEFTLSADGMNIPEDLSVDVQLPAGEESSESEPGVAHETERKGTTLVPPTQKTEKKKPVTSKEETTATQKSPAVNSGGVTMDSLESADKAYVMNIYKRFSASEISTVSGMLSDGITSEEKKQIKAIVYAKVSSEEIKKLSQIAKKYQ